MSHRTLGPLALTAVVAAALGVAAGSFVSSKRTEERLAETAARLDALQEDLGAQREAPGSVGTAGRGLASRDREALVQAVVTRVQREMGLLPLRLLREKRNGFVELYSNDARASDSYGTAGHLGNGYFLTVKHGVMALEPGEGRTLDHVRLRVGDRMIAATVVDHGDARHEVDPGDWAIVRVEEPVALPALRVDLAYDFPFADPIVRMGNDYSRGIIASTGYVGQRSQGLVTCLTDGHPGVSGGGVLNQRGDLVGIPVGRLQGDYRFSFILPIRAEMLRKVAGVASSGDGR